MDIKNAVEMEANLFGVVNDTTIRKREWEHSLRESCKPHRFLNYDIQTLSGRGADIMISGCVQQCNM